MDHRLLYPEIQQFIDAGIGKDISRLALSKNPFPEISWPVILNQIAAKTKAKDKLPTWFKAKNILYPDKLSIEQTSSEATAAFKATLVFGDALIDLTGGFGVDDYYFSKQIKNVAHCEIDAGLSEIAAWNFNQLGAHIECHSGDGTQVLKDLARKWDWIYIDPSRRNDSKGKVFLLKDCLPEVPSNLDFYFGFSDNILIKTSPLLDISAGLGELMNVRAVHVVALRNEVKELLFVLQRGYSGEIRMHAVDLADDRSFGYVLGREHHPAYQLPSTYLYEPNAAIMKSGGFDAVATQYRVGKLHRHSHLYTSHEFVVDFPGRTFKIDSVIRYSKNEMAVLASKKANITTRNFPDSVDQIRKKWKIADGGELFCFFTTDRNNDKIVLLCTKFETPVRTNLS